jgi:hypothetical protein
MLSLAICSVLLGAGPVVGAPTRAVLSTDWNPFARSFSLAVGATGSGNVTHDATKEAEPAPKEYQPAWLVAGLVGGAALGIPTGIGIKHGYCGPPGSGSLAGAIVVPIVAIGLGALLGNAAANDSDGAKVTVVVLDAVGPLVGLSAVTLSALDCH